MEFRRNFLRKLSIYLKITALLALNLLSMFFIIQNNYLDLEKTAKIDRVFYSSSLLSIPSVLGQSREGTPGDETHFEELNMEHIMRLKDGDTRYKDTCLEASNKQECRIGCQKNEEEFKQKQLEKQQALAKKAAQRAKPVVKPKPKHPMPYVFDVVNGRRVCNKKNDKPGKSTKGKGKHLDMECCLDPDEIPNSNCYYDPKKYGKFL